MKKDAIMQLTKFLPGKDAQLGLNLLNQRKYEDLKDVVDSDIALLDKIEDQTGEIQKCLEKLYKLSEGLNDYILVFEEIDYEEI